MLNKFSIVLLFLVLILTACSSSEEKVSNTDSDVEEVDSSNLEVTEEEDVASEDSEELLVEEEESIPAEAFYAEGFKQDLLAITDNMLELSQESYDFIVANHKLLPAFNEEDIAKVKTLVDPSVTFKLLNKNAAPHLSKFASFTGSVITVEEKQLESGDTVSLTHIFDEEFNSYQVLMYKSTGDILEEDQVQFWGIPVGASHFENVSGGTTNVQVFFGAHMEKLN